MTELEFAMAYLGEYTIRGTEIIPRYCPYCNGGEHHDKNTFALNMEKHTFNCRRGSCGKQGHFTQLCKDFGAEPEREPYAPKVRRSYKRPETKPQKAKDKITEYLKLRGITEETAAAYGIGQDEHGNMVFPYYRTKEDFEKKAPTFVKFRKPRKIQKGERKMWREAETEPILFGMHLCKDFEKLYLYEGECFRGDTEILTPGGWIALDRYAGQQVLQVNPDMTAGFVAPSRYVVKPFCGDMVEIRRGGNYYSLTTPEHNLVYRDKKGLRKIKAQDHAPEALHIPTAVHLQGCGLPLSNDQIALWLAVSADGTIDVRKGSKYHKAASKRYVRLAFVKGRKIERLGKILDRLKIPHTSSTHKGGSTGICFHCPEWLGGKYLPYEFATQSTAEQREFILSEMVEWDGNRVPGRNQAEYSTKILHNAVVMQTIAHLTGRMSTIMERRNAFGIWYKVSILHGKSSVGTQRLDKDKRRVKHDGNVYCVTVPSGMILVRQHGCISVSGNCDAMCGYQASGENCVSVPSGCEDYTWLETCGEWVAQFETVIIMADNDDAGIKMLRELSIKLDNRVMQPDFAEYAGCKDANEILARRGADQLLKAMQSARIVETKGLLNLAELPSIDIDSLPRALSGIHQLDSATGGMLMGDLSVWTGKRGEGKSTILTQILLDAIDQGLSVCAYSGEVPADRFKYVVNLQAAGDAYAREREDTLAERIVQYVPRESLAKIGDWYNGKFWLYDNRIAEKDEAESILRLFEISYKRYDCRVFMVDNLMTVSTCRNDADYYQMQADFTIRLRKLAEKLGAHIHLVVHPRKGGIKDSDSVGGLSTITNIACNVFSMRRATEDETGLGYDATLTCLKNRAYGENTAVQLQYSQRSRRFTERDMIQKQYGWAEQPKEYVQQTLGGYDGKTPFEEEAEY